MDPKHTLFPNHQEKRTSISEGRRRRSLFWEALLILFLLIATLTPFGPRQFFFGLLSKAADDVSYSLRNPAYPIEVEHGAVASESELCSKIGVEILKEGGNAVDATVATTFCIGVVNMFS